MGNENENKKTIEVGVVGRVYPIQIGDPIEEEKIKKAAQLINEKVAQYQQKFEGKDVHECLAMAALTFVIKLIEADGRQHNAEIIDQMADLDDWLGQYLAKQNIGSSFK